MEMRLKRGRGYISADKNFDADLAWASFRGLRPLARAPRQLCCRSCSPGPDHDYDKLTLEVWTNGAVRRRCSRAGRQAAQGHMNIFINFEEEIEAEARGKRAAPAAQRQSESQR